MMTLVRTTVELPDTQISALARFCQKEKITRAEAIRRAIEKLLSNHNSAAERKEDLSASFGLWRGRPEFDGRSFVDALRSEWEDGPSA